MRKIKDKQTEILESELTVVGFIFIFILMFGQIFVQENRIKSLDKELYEAKVIAVDMNNAKELYVGMVASLNDELDENTRDLNNYKYLERLLKDLHLSETRDAN